MTSSPDQPKEKPNYFPLAVALERAGLCETVSDTAFRLSKSCGRIELLFTTLTRLTDVDLHQTIERNRAVKADMEELAVRAKLTGATISIQLKALEDWQRLVTDGLIMDVFTADGMAEMSDRVKQATDFVTEAVRLLENLTHTLTPPTAETPGE